MIDEMLKNCKKVYCKKSISPSNKKNFIEGNYYFYYKENNINYWVVEDNIFDYGYRFYKNQNYDNTFNFLEYFCTLKDERKLKLKKLTTEEKL